MLRKDSFKAEGFITPQSPIKTINIGLINKKSCNMKRVVGLLLLSFNVSFASNVCAENIGLVIAQTKHPSVGHRPNKLIFGYVLRADDTYGIEPNSYKGYNLPLFPGLFIGARSATTNRDPDNKFLAMDDQETVINLRSIFRIDDSGNISPIAGEQDREITQSNTPYYYVSSDDINYRLRYVFRRKTQSGHNMLPDESLSWEFETDRVISPSFKGSITPVLTVDGAERSDFRMQNGETGYLRFKLPDELKNTPIFSKHQNHTTEGVIVSDLERNNNEYSIKIQISTSNLRTHYITSPYYISSTLGYLWNKSVMLKVN